VHHGVSKSVSIPVVVASVRSYELCYGVCVEAVSVAAEVRNGHLRNKGRASYGMHPLPR
jgi:hypothetical protein